MMKMDCDIIQDLIPSYVDEICSEASKRCVEEHIAECENCKKTVQLYRENELTGKRMEQREVDGFKKLKAKMKRQNIVSLFLILFVAIFCIYTFQSNYAYFTKKVYYVLLFSCMIATFFVKKAQAKQERATRKEYLLWGGSIIAMGYAFCMFYYCIKSVEQGIIPFGIELHYCGPFLRVQWGILCLTQIIILEELLRGILKKNRSCQWMLSMNLAGIFLLLAYTVILGHMASAQGVADEIVSVTVGMILLGAIGTLVHIVLGRKRKYDK